MVQRRGRDHYNDTVYRCPSTSLPRRSVHLDRKSHACVRRRVSRLEQEHCQWLPDGSRIYWRSNKRHIQHRHVREQLNTTPTSLPDDHPVILAEGLGGRIKRFEEAANYEIMRPSFERPLLHCLADE